MTLRGHPQSLRTSHGFTLIELMVVVLVIGILAAIAIPNYVSAKRRAVNATMKSDLRHIMVALEDYNIQKGTLPPDLPTFEAATVVKLSKDVAWDLFTPEVKDGVPSVHIHLTHPQSPTTWHAHYPAEHNRIEPR